MRFGRKRNRKAKRTHIEIVVREKVEKKKADTKKKEPIVKEVTETKKKVEVKKQDVSKEPKKVEEKKLPFPLVIKLKMGCRVIIKSNEKNLTIHGTKPLEKIDVVNGDTGTFRGLDKHQRLLIELDRNHEIICLKKKKSEKIEYKKGSMMETTEDEDGQMQTQEGSIIEEKVLGRYGQYPIKLAYASTIHSAQGSTLDRVHLMLSGKPFATGLTYVALSRIKSLKNLTLNRPITHDDITVAKGLTSKVNGQGELGI